MNFVCKEKLLDDARQTWIETVKLLCYNHHDIFIRQSYQNFVTYLQALLQQIQYFFRDDHVSCIELCQNFLDVLPCARFVKNVYRYGSGYKGQELLNHFASLCLLAAFELA